ncbi:RsmD family RNA methyltransferase [Leucobacter sp. GX24907]
MTRIIAGAAGSLRLEVPKSGTRPTSDRVREAIFSALESWGLLDGSRVLDLYAGSGALGLEAASRGAAEVVLIERHAQAAQVAQRNTRTVLGAFTRGSSGSSGPAPRIEVVRQSVQGYLDGNASVDRSRGQVQRDPGVAHWDVVLLDPPYDLGEVELTANLAAIVPLLGEGAVVLVERSSRSPEPALPAGLVPLRSKRYGETALWWYEPSPNTGEPNPNTGEPTPNTDEAGPE